MSEFNQNSKITINNERSFAFTFGIFFLLIGLYLFYINNKYAIGIILLSFIIVLIGLIVPKFLKLPNFLWYKLGLILGSIVSPVVMMIIYLITIIPIGLLLKLFRKDILSLKLDKNISSYWIESSRKINSMKKQF